MAERWRRFVAIGDSSAEGLDDPDGAGGYRGWADRLAVHLAHAQGEVAYANLAVRGRLAGQVREEQVPAALALEPDLVAVIAGMNDLLRPGGSLPDVRDDLAAIHGALNAAGATVVTFTLPDATSAVPLGARLRPRLHAMNDMIRSVADDAGSQVLDLEPHPAAADPRLWSEDRLHANSRGHARIAAGLAWLLDLPGSSRSWAAPLPPAARTGAWQRAAADLRWAGTYLLPWIGRRLLGRSSGDGCTPKLPEPVRLTAVDTGGGTEPRIRWGTDEMPGRS